VKSVRWHPHEGWFLASGGYDKVVNVVDCRNNGDIAMSYRDVPSDIEDIVWDHYFSYHLYCSLDSGQVSRPKWLSAHYLSNILTLHISRLPSMYALLVMISYCYVKGGVL
jgi:WD40 repeat protein